MKFLKGVLLVLFIVKLAECAPVESFKVQPVDLAYFCAKKVNDENSSLAPIILLHGLGSTKEGWEGFYQILTYQTGRKVCVPDLRNHGKSPFSQEADIEAMSADIVHLLDTLKVKKAIVFGHSLGGKVAVHVALNYPERVEKLIVEDMRPNGVTPKVLKDAKLFLTLLQAGIAAIPEGSTDEEAKMAFIKFVVTKLQELNIELNIDPKQIKAIPIYCVEGKCKWKVNMDLFVEAAKNPEKYLTPSEGLYENPTLFIYGTKSPFEVGQDVSNILRLFPNAKVVPVEGAGHIIHITHKEQFWREVVKFINHV